MLRKKILAVLIGNVFAVLLLIFVEAGCRIYEVIGNVSDRSVGYPAIKLQSSRSALKPLKFRLYSSAVTSPPHDWSSLRENVVLDQYSETSGLRFVNDFYINPMGKTFAKEVVRGFDKIIYDVVYEFDEQGRRIVANEAQKNRPLHFLTLGCSHTLGEGLGPEGTLAFHFAELNSQYTPYVLAQQAASPAQILALVRHFRGFENIPQTNGLAVFRLYPSHFSRLIGANREANLDHRASAKYSQSGRIDVSQTFAQGRPRWLWLTRILRSSAIVRTFSLSYPFTYGDQHMRLMADVLAALRDEYQLQTSNKNPFVILLSQKESTPWNVFFPYLEERGLLYLDYGDIAPSSLAPDYPFLHNDQDGHYTSDVNKAFAKILTKDLADF